jgi:hypothetical protein
MPFLIGLAAHQYHGWNELADQGQCLYQGMSRAQEKPPDIPCTVALAPAGGTKDLLSVSTSTGLLLEIAFFAFLGGLSFLAIRTVKRLLV